MRVRSTSGSSTAPTAERARRSPRAHQRVAGERLGDSAATTVLHRGVTGQDILDTAIMLVARRAPRAPLLKQMLPAAAELCAGLAERHRNTLQAGRTLLQQAVPLTFGLKAAEWLTALDGSWAGLASVREQELAVQLGGAAGTLATFGDRGLAVVSDLAEQLGLAEPDLPWHTIRLRPARVACSLGVALGAMGKIAGDVVLLAQTEVDELAEKYEAEGKGGSSTMPHKPEARSVQSPSSRARNADPASSRRSCRRWDRSRSRRPGVAGGVQGPSRVFTTHRLGRLCVARELLEGLQVHADRMRANLDLTNRLLMSERRHRHPCAVTEQTPRPGTRRDGGPARRSGTPRVEGRAARAAGGHGRDRPGRLGASALSPRRATWAPRTS